MRFGVRLLERGGAHMRVNLRGNKALVAEHFLHASNVRPTI